MLYQLSYGPLTSIGLSYPISIVLTLQWPGAESNHRHHDFQSRALPTELPGPKKTARPFGGGRLGEGWALRAFLEAPIDGRPFLTRPRIRHRPPSGLLRIGPEHQ